MWPFSRKAAKAAPRYYYYVVENSFIARIEQEAAYLRPERYTEDGQWVPYNDVWDVSINGRHVDGEAAALAEYREILELRKGRQPQ
jgi:hypothetical protein